MKKTVLNVMGMSCSHCERAVTTALMELSGVLSVKVDLKGNTVAVEYDDGKVTMDAITAEIIDAGYEVE